MTPRPDVPQKDPAIRLQPNTDPPRPAWARKLCNGWHALRLKDKVTRVVAFVMRCAGKLVAFVPAETPGRGFEVPLLFRIDECLGPLREVLPMSFYFSDDVEVFAFDCALLFQGQLLLDSALQSRVVTATTQIC